MVRDYRILQERGCERPDEHISLKKKLKVRAHSFSKSATQKIIDAGGTTEVI